MHREHLAHRTTHMGRALSQVVVYLRSPILPLFVLSFSILCFQRKQMKLWHCIQMSHVLPLDFHSQFTLHSFLVQWDSLCLTRATVSVKRDCRSTPKIVWLKNWTIKLLATSTLNRLLMKAGLSLNVFWQGTSKPLATRCRPQLFHVQDTLDSILHLFGLTFLLGILFLVTK